MEALCIVTPLKTVLNWLKPYRELNISTSIVFVSDGLPGDLLSTERF
jgi:hypothetical protein